MPNITETIETTGRPSLESVWTYYRDLNGIPNAAIKPINSLEGFTFSPVSSKSLPSPLYPSYDRFVEMRERAIVSSLNESFDQSPTNLPALKYIHEDTPLAKGFEDVTVLPPLNLQHGLPSPTSPILMNAPLPKRNSLRRSKTLLEARNININSELPEVPSIKRDRSNSTSQQTRPLPPPPSPPSSEESATEIREQLRSWGRVYYGNTKTADAFVVPRSLRRHSGVDTTSRDDIKTPKMKKPNQVTFRAIIRPKALERQSFLIQRSFDIEELRATIPDNIQPPLPAISEQNASISERLESPRALYDKRRSSAKSGELLFGRGRASSITDHEALIRETKAVPIHLKYARAYLPVLGALLVSGHVREGDIIYLPLPFPEAWPQTLKYVYTGQGEPTEAVKENVTYLAGKV